MIGLSVIVPVYNEAADLWAMAEGLAAELDRIVGGGAWQFVLCDNGSVDATPRIIDRIIEAWPASRRVHLPQSDYGEALVQGLRHATGEWAYIINVDFWDPVFLGWAWRHRGLYDLVLGSKRADMSLNRQHKYRRILSWGLNSVLQLVFGFVGSDTHGQKFLHLPTLWPVAAQCVMRRGQFDTELTLRALRQEMWLAEVPVPIVELRRPRNLMLAKVRRNLVDIVRLRRALRNAPGDRPIRYHRWAREDLAESASVQAEFLLAAAERRRRRVA